MMTRDEALKYTYTQMVKNNPDEAIKNLIMFNKINSRYLKIILEAQEYIKEHFVATETEEVLLKILKGEDNESKL